jgi:HlyD family secretion protein
MRRILRRVLPLIVLAVVAVGVYLWWTTRTTVETGGLAASGTIEATQVTVAAEASGRIKDVLVVEGDTIRAGQPLVQLDDALLQAQRKQVLASLEAVRGAQAAAEAATMAAQAQLD